MYLGFFIVIFLAIIQGIISARTIMTITARVDRMANEYTHEVVLASNLRNEISMAGYFMRAYFISLNPNDYDSGVERIKGAEKLLVELRALDARQTNLPKLRGLISKLDPDLRRYAELCASIDVLARKNNSLRLEEATSFRDMLTKRDGLSRYFNEDLAVEESVYRANFSREAADQLVRRHTRITLLENLLKQAATLTAELWIGMGLSDNEAIGKLREDSARLVAAAEDLLRDTRQQKNIPPVREFVEYANMLNESVKSIYENGSEMGALGAERVGVFNSLLSLSAELAEAGENSIKTADVEVQADAKRDLRLVVAAVILMVGLGLAAALWIVRSISTEVEKTAALLETAANRLNREAASINIACDELAEMSSQQSSSLETTSSALEEVTSMAKQNSDNIQRTNSETSQVVRQIEEGSEAVADMNKAMAEIEDSAGKISSIIKTIEQIAFQTNLLALNAAVEAARAGEAGMGFAVVADEVRNLAQRSAQATHDTTDLIHGTVERVRRGGEISQRLSEMFHMIETSAQNVGRLVGEITTAIHEQSAGVNQINDAVMQIDNATRQNAESAKKVRDNAQDINSDSQSLMDANADLHRLVYGKDAPMRTPVSAGQNVKLLK
jgi:methyl-accepting chemotaxis protein